MATTAFTAVRPRSRSPLGREDGRVASASDRAAGRTRSVEPEARAWKPNGKFAPWLFRFAAFDQSDEPPDVVSKADDTSLSREDSNKTIFSGQIEIDEAPNVFRTCWAELIKAAKTALPCWNVDTQAIWERFLAFNRARGNDRVPAGFLLGFMRRWRTSSSSTAPSISSGRSRAQEDPKMQELHDQIRAAPSANRQFHASDLCRLIGQAAYDARVLDVVRQFGCPRFAAILAVHGGRYWRGRFRGEGNIGRLT